MFCRLTTVNLSLPTSVYNTYAFRICCVKFLKFSDRSMNIFQGPFT